MPQTSRSTTVPLGARLLALAAAGILPVAAVSGIGLYALGHQQRVQAERVGLELARALATGVDAELRSSISVLEVLATATALDHDDLTGFGLRARRVAQTLPNWAAIMLADRRANGSSTRGFRGGRPRRRSIIASVAGRPAARAD